MAKVKGLWVGVLMLLNGSVIAVESKDRAGMAARRVNARVAVSRIDGRLMGTRLSAERPAEDERKTVTSKNKWVRKQQRAQAVKRASLREHRQRKTRRVAAMR